MEDFEYYLLINLISNVGSDTPYDYSRYDYKLELKSQEIKTDAKTNDFKKVKFEIMENENYAIVGKERYKFKKTIYIPAVDNYVYGPKTKLNHNVAHSNYEVLSFQIKKKKVKKAIE